MYRSWGVVTLGVSAVPWFGDVTTAAVAASADSGIIPVTVANTSRYRVGDRIVLEPGTANQDTLLVEEIPVAAGTVLNCVSEGGLKTKAHALGSIVQLSIPCSQVIITALKSNTGDTWQGSDSTVTNTGGGSAFSYAASGGGSFNTGVAQWNIIRSSDGWMAGTSGDKVGVVAVVV